VIIATGASPRLTGRPGEKELYGGKGVTTCATCDGAFYRKMEVAVLGGGDSAAEEALFLTRFASKVYLVHRRNELRASKIMAERATSHEKIQMVWDSVPVEVLGVKEGAVSGLKIRHVKTNAESVLPVKGIFVAIGHVPNTGPFAPPLDVDEGGYFKPQTGSQVRTNDSRGVRGGRLLRPRLPAGDHRRRHGLRGCDRGRTLARRAPERLIPAQGTS
jgi:thioredoxin reductase (NADPH)